jgi:hypothetical protein
MRKATWLLKSFVTHTSLVLDTAKAKLNSMPILLAKGALEPRLGSMSSKMWDAPFPFKSPGATPEEATSLGVAMGEISKALAHLPPSKDSHSRKEVDSGLEEANLEASTSE